MRISPVRVESAGFVVSIWFFLAALSSTLAAAEGSTRAPFHRH
jgi:hypothetical protein